MSERCSLVAALTLLEAHRHDFDAAVEAARRDEVSPVIIVAVLAKVAAEVFGHSTFTTPAGRELTDTEFKGLVEDWLAAVRYDAWHHRTGLCDGQQRTH